MNPHIDKHYAKRSEEEVKFLLFKLIRLVPHPTLEKNLLFGATTVDCVFQSFNQIFGRFIHNGNATTAFTIKDATYQLKYKITINKELRWGI